MWGDTWLERRAIAQALAVSFERRTSNFQHPTSKYEPVRLNSASSVFGAKNLRARTFQQEIPQTPDCTTAGGGTRTRTELTPQGILSPLRLPFRHAGVTVPGAAFHPGSHREKLGSSASGRFF